MSNMSWTAQTVLEAEYHVLHVALTFMKKDKDIPSKPPPLPGVALFKVSWGMEQPRGALLLFTCVCPSS